MRRFFYIQAILFIHVISIAQQAADTSTVSGSDPVTIYYQTLGEQSPLFNAREYVDFPGIIHVGHPFYKTTEFTKGAVHYDGMIFEDAMLLYDIINDKLLVLHYNGIYKIDLPVQKISEFKLLDCHFIRLFPDSAKVIEEGFYERLYKGKITVFAKRQKNFREERTANDILRVVDEKNFLYIEKQGVYHPVKNIKGLLNVLNNRREAVRQHLRKKGIKFRKNREAAVLTAAQYYDSLSN